MVAVSWCACMALASREARSCGAGASGTQRRRFTSSRSRFLRPGPSHRKLTEPAVPTRHGRTALPPDVKGRTPAGADRGDAARGQNQSLAVGRQAHGSSLTLSVLCPQPARGRLCLKRRESGTSRGEPQSTRAGDVASVLLPIHRVQRKEARGMGHVWHAGHRTPPMPGRAAILVTRYIGMDGVVHIGRHRNLAELAPSGRQAAQGHHRGHRRCEESAA